MPASLAQFSAVADAVASTSSKLRKQALLGEYFRSLAADDDLRLGVRFMMGRPFARTSERVLGASGAIVSQAILDHLAIDGRSYHDLVVRSGEIGEALAVIFENHRPAALTETVGLTLRELYDLFDAIASTSNQESKRQIVRDLLGRLRTPREAAYAMKILFGDLRIGASEGVVQAGVAEAFGKTLAQIQRAQLLLGDLEEVAILARSDALASIRFKLFHPIQFMLATPQETSADAVATMDGKTFWAEHKLDGIRAQVHKSADRIAIYTRTMDRTDESFPDVVDALARLPGEFLLDGEIVPFRDGCVQPFASIQKRLGRKTLTAKMLRDHPAVFVAFDLLYRDGTIYLDRPLRERRAALEDLAGVTPHAPGRGNGQSIPATALCTADPPDPNRPLLLTQVIEVSSAEQIDAAFAAAREARNEGLVLKDPDSIYSPGRRGQAWLKIKSHLPTLDCVVTAAEYGHGKRRNVLSDYTFAVWDRDPSDPAASLVNVGKAYSGVTDEEINRLTELFLGIATAQWGRVYAVRPQVVLEVAFDQIQKSDRHDSGFALRFPRIKRIRWDKRIEDADRLQRVIELYESPANFGRGLKEPPAAPAEPTLFDSLDPLPPGG
jgi:DNA ligase-1